MWYQEKGSGVRMEKTRKEPGVEEKGEKRSFAEAVRGKQRSNHEMPSLVKIYGGQVPCVVKVERELEAVDMEWLENFLRLRKNKGLLGRNRGSEVEKIQIYGSEGVGGNSSRSLPQMGNRTKDQEMGRQECRPEMSGRGKMIRQCKLARRSRCVAMKKAVEKGKKKWCKRIKVRPRKPISQNGKIELEKMRVTEVAGEVREEESSSSSEEELREKRFLDSCREIGECSKKVDRSGAVEEFGLNKGSRPKQVSFSLDTVAQCGREGPNCNQGVDLCVDLGQILVKNMGWREEVGRADPEGGVSSESLGSVEEVIRESFEVENQRKKDGGAKVVSYYEVEEAVSSDNQVIKEVMVRATIDVENLAAATVADSEEEVAVEGRNSRRTERGLVTQGSRLRRSNQSKAANSHGMTTRNSINRQTNHSDSDVNEAVEEAAKVCSVQCPCCFLAKLELSQVVMVGMGSS
ncbi:hypothetical protein LWI29_013878 [Acer saccharum]|uniref:Uncharacterized protein n=1 Tax=Acer saccharum TaxID=4024 RepID=A0AA39VJ18_ACESA|nr:hypothetical protein LWI29_013878 [Acer saccharum]